MNWQLPNQEKGEIKGESHLSALFIPQPPIPGFPFSGKLKPDFILLYKTMYLCNPEWQQK